MNIDCHDPMEPGIPAMAIFLSKIEALENGIKESLGKTFPGILSWE